MKKIKYCPLCSSEKITKVSHLDSKERGVYACFKCRNGFCAFFMGKNVIKGGYTKVVDVHRKGGIRPHFDVYIGRRVRNTEFTNDSKWHNPFLPLEKYEKYILEKIKQDPEFWDLEDLRGRTLGCWCINTDKETPLKCHGQILLKLIREKNVL